MCYSLSNGLNIIGSSVPHTLLYLPVVLGPHCHLMLESVQLWLFQMTVQGQGGGCRVLYKLKGSVHLPFGHGAPEFSLLTYSLDTFISSHPFLNPGRVMRTLWTQQGESRTAAPLKG